MGYIIDTNIFISAARGRFSLETLMAQFPGQPMAISAITASELYHGVYRARDSKFAERRRQFVEYVLNLAPIIPFDLTIAQTHAQIWATLEMQGQIIGAHDLQIAATAQVLNYGVITMNEREFVKVPGLIVINPLT